MPYQSQLHLISAAASTVIYAVFLTVMTGQVSDASPPLELLRIWSSGLLILIPVYVLMVIVLYIVFAVVRAAVTREQGIPVTDELARLIDLKAARNSGAAVSLALVAALAAAAVGGGVTGMFITLVVGLYVSGVVGDLTQIILYRRGV